MTDRTILITGCSSGIGLTCATGLKARGWRVFATARKKEDIERLQDLGFEVFYLDYSEPASIEAAVKEIARRTQGRLYALFNNGAYGQPGAVEDLSREVLEAQFQANVFGWHQLVTACLPLMRQQGAGRIIQNSSVLGLVAMKWRGAYNASKFAIEALSDTLRLELRGSGIDVVLIEPGPIYSRFKQNALAAFDRNIDVAHSHYKEAYEAQRRRLSKPDKSVEGGADLPAEPAPQKKKKKSIFKRNFKLPPEAVLEKLIHALESPRPRIRYYVTTPTYIMAWARRLLPQRVLDRFVNAASDN